MQLVRPFWVDSAIAGRAQLALLGVAALSLVKTGISVLWLSLNREIFDALSAGNEAVFYAGIGRFMVSLLAGVPVYVMYSYFLVRSCWWWVSLAPQCATSGARGPRSWSCVAANLLMCAS